MKCLKMARRRKKNKNGKHQNGVDSLEQRLLDSGHYESVSTNEVYELGECDIKTKALNRREYWEYKCNHTGKGYTKARRQLQRWSWYMYSKDPSKDWYGIYIAGNMQTPIVMVKNGKFRNYD